VITRTDLRQGELICSCCGLISVLEEVDYRSTLPQHTIYRLTGRDLFLSPPIAHYSPMFWRIRRSLASNCELKLYRDDGEWKVGLFATEVTLMPELIKKRETIQIAHNSSVVISAGGELTLPFDVTPVHIRVDGEWKTGKHQHMAMRPKDITPIRPSSSQTGDFDMQFARESKPPQAPGVTLQGLFGDSMIPSFIIDPTARSKLTRSRYPLPRELVSLPMPGKKSWNVPLPLNFDMKPYTRYIGSQWLDPPIEIPDDSVRPPVADFWDADDPEDFVDVTDADLQQK
jgi:hypothetical protein